MSMMASLHPVDLSRVRIGGKLGRCVDMALWKNLMVLDIDEDFLRPFRNRKSPADIQRYDRFIGIGMLIDALVQFSAYTGDKAVLARKRDVVRQIAATQDADGYIGVFLPDEEASHLFIPYSFHEAAYLVLGLTNDHIVHGETESLASAKRLADHLMDQWRFHSEDHRFTTLGTAEGFMALYEATGERRYLSFAADEPMGRRRRIAPAALRDWEQPLYEPRVPQGASGEIEDADLDDFPHDGCHMYRLLCRAMSQLRLYQLEPAEELLTMPRRLIEAMIRKDRACMVITGSTSMDECYHEDQSGEGRLAETCATVYQLFLLHEWIRISGDLRWGDVMERTVYNSLLAAQSPDGRSIRYSIPFSGPREYTDFDSYCCPNNFRRGMAFLPTMAVYGSDHAVAVNLYGVASAAVELAADLHVDVAMESDYPASGRVQIRINPSRCAVFDLLLRIPTWCSSPRVVVNGTDVDPGTGGGSAIVSRQWCPGDRVDLDLPMEWRFVRGRKTQKERVAVLKGPQVFCISREHNPQLGEIVMRDITIDPSSLEDDPRGCRLRAWSPDADLSRPSDLELFLEPFPEPSGEEIYFRSSAPEMGVDDELCPS